MIFCSAFCAAMGTHTGETSSLQWNSPLVGGPVGCFVDRSPGASVLTSRRTLVEVGRPSIPRQRWRWLVVSSGAGRRGSAHALLRLSQVGRDVAAAACNTTSMELTAVQMLFLFWGGEGGTVYQPTVPWEIFQQSWMYHFSNSFYWFKPLDSCETALSWMR